MVLTESGIPAATRRPDRWPFTGRADELAHARAAMDDPASAGVWIVSEAGVGRSRLAEELIGAVELSGTRVRRATGAASTALVPLGALAHLLTPEVLLAATGHSADPVRLLAAARRALSESGGRTSLMVDDAHLLDAVSLTLLAQLIQDAQVTLILTVQSDGLQPDALRSLCHNDRLRRIDIAPLDDEAVALLLQRGLGGPVAGRTERALRRSSGGNPLLLRELVRAAEAEGVLADVDGVWTLVGALPTRHRAAELLHDRVAAVTGDARSVLELLAIVDSANVDALTEWFGADVLDWLEHNHLVVLRPTAASDGTEAMELAHPLLVDAVRNATPTLRGRSILRTWASHIEARPQRGLADPLLIAGWRLQTGDAVEPILASSTAALARHAGDYELTLHYARAAHEAQPTVGTGILLGEALYETGAFTQANSVLAGADATDASPAMVLRLAGLHSTVLLFGLLDPDTAFQVLKDAESRLAAEGLESFREELVAREANVQLYGGHPTAALRTLAALDVRDRLANRDNIDDSPDDARTAVLWATPGVPAIALAGRTGEAIELAKLAYVRHLELADDVALTTPETHLLTLCLAFQEHGSLDEADGVADAGYRASVAAGSLMGQTWFSLTLARTALIRYRAATTVRWCREASAVTAAAGWHGPRSMALAGLAAGSSISGDLATANQALTKLAALDGDFGFLLPERCLGRAWSLVAQHRRADAVGVLREGAELAAATGHSTVESWLLYEIARIGAPSDVVDRLDELAESCDGNLVATRAQHVRARVSGSVDDLVSAADSFDAMGCHLAAAEALHQAADRVRASGDQRRANGLSTRSSGQAARAEGAHSDDLVSVVAVVPLTDREREVAVQAAAGTPSQEIADRLFLSVRTVNNHLQNVYTKLGVTSRPELATVLGTD